VAAPAPNRLIGSRSKPLFTLPIVEQVDQLAGLETVWEFVFVKDPDDKNVVICMTLGLHTGKHVARGRKVPEEIIYFDKGGQLWLKLL
jgi:hypothetical protein